MRRFVVAVASVALGLSLAGPAEPASAAQKPGDATNYQVNAGHTGLAPGPALSNSMRRLWSKDFGPGTSYPLIVGNRVFVAARPKSTNDIPRPGFVYAFDRRTGRQLWRSAGVGTDYSTATLAYGSGRLVVLEDDDRFEDKHSRLKGLNPATGKAVWTKKLVAPPYTSITHSASKPLTVRGGVAYLNFSYSGDNYLAVDVRTGKTKWKLFGTNDNSLGQAVSGNRVYYGSSCFWGARTLSGKKVWRDDIGCSGGVGFTTSVLAGNRLWVHAALSSSRVVDARNGKELFRFDSTRVPTVVGSRAFLTPDAPSAPWEISLQAVDSATGAKLWKRRPAGDKYGQIVGPPIATAKVVYVTTSSGWVFGYSTATGKQVWSAKSGGTVDAQNQRIENVGSAIGRGVLAVTATNRLTVFG